MFAYVFGDFLVVDLRLQFGWRGSPDWFGLTAGAIEYAQCNTPAEEAVLTPSGIKVVEHVKVEPPTGRSVVLLCLGVSTGREWREILVLLALLPE